VFGILFAPVTLLLVLFLAPMLIMVQMSLVRFPPDVDSGWTLGHYGSVLTNELNRTIALNTVFIATTAMVAMLLVAIPLAYFMVFKAGRLELLILLALVLADELAPVVKIYAWQVILGRQGVINFLVPGEPIEWLIYSRFAVILTLTTTYLTYTTIPIYAAMKAIDPDLLEAADDLGAKFLTRFRKILVPLAAPGIFVALILVYIPLYSEFATPALVGGTGGFMVGNAIQEAILEAGNRGVGSAMSFMLLVLSGLVAWLGYRGARISRLQATA
jgi:ABC-type spermidine/putrescine transport system permease subunit I